MTADIHLKESFYVQKHYDFLAYGIVEDNISNKSFL
jgi:hypothetical protein